MTTIHVQAKAGGLRRPRDNVSQATVSRQADAATNASRPAPMGTYLALLLVCPQRAPKQTRPKLRERRELTHLSFASRASPNAEKEGLVHTHARTMPPRFFSSPYKNAVITPAKVKHLFLSPRTNQAV